MIEITKLDIDGYEFPVPPGLNELLKDCWVPKSQIKRSKISEQYEHETKWIDGKLITIMRPKNKEASK